MTDRNGHVSSFVVGDNQGNDPTGQQPVSVGNKGSVLYVQDGGYNDPSSPSYHKQFTYQYNLYGLVRSSAGTATSKHRFVGSLGHPSEHETGLIYMRARYMDPQTGRFASEDAAKHTANWLAYASHNPVCYRDPTGRASDDTFDPVYKMDWESFWEEWNTEYFIEIFATGVEFAAYAYSIAGFEVEAMILEAAANTFTLVSGIGAGKLAAEVGLLVNERESAWYVELLKDQ